MQLTEYHAKHFAYELTKRCSLDSVEKVAPIFPSPGRPHYLKSAGPDGGVYVRVDPINRRADRELIEELRRFARGESYDEQAMPELDSEALDFRAASELFAPVRELKRADLETLRLVTKHQERKVAAVGGMLLFGRKRERFFPDAWIEAGRFSGTDDLRHGISKLRNRVIGRVFHELGLIEQWGSGIQRMTAACSEAGLAVPALEEIGTRFCATLNTARTGSPVVDTTDQAIDE